MTIEQNKHILYGHDRALDKTTDDLHVTISEGYMTLYDFETMYDVSPSQGTSTMEPVKVVVR